MSHSDVLATTAFYLDPFRSLVLAIIRAEGGQAGFIRALQCSFPEIREFPIALARTCKTLRNRIVEYEAYRDRLSYMASTGDRRSKATLLNVGPLFEMRPRPGTDPWTWEQHPRQLVVSESFIRYLASHSAPGPEGKPIQAGWAPLGAANDPNNLNANWPGNVLAIYRQILDEKEPERLQEV